MIEPVDNDYVKHKENFYSKLSELISSKSLRKTFTQEDYLSTISRLKNNENKKTSKDYYLSRKYGVVTMLNIDRLIKLDHKNSKNQVLYYAYDEEIFDIILAAHKLVGHGGIKKTSIELEKKWSNITRPIIILFKSFCKSCLEANIKKGTLNLIFKNETSN